MPGRDLVAAFALDTTGVLLVFCAKSVLWASLRLFDIHQAVRVLTNLEPSLSTSAIGRQSNRGRCAREQGGV
jgi:hypothetical protein